MKLSIQRMFWLSLAFACLCIAYAGVGFSSIEPTRIRSSLKTAADFAWFWLFPGSIGVVLAIVSWQLTNTKQDSSGE